MQQRQVVQKGRQAETLPAKAIDWQARKRKLLYFGTTSVPTALILDVMTSGQHAECVVVGLLIGGACYYWQEQIHTTIGPALRMLGEVWAYLNRNKAGRTRATYRLLSKEWWLTGEMPVQYAPPDENQGARDLSVSPANALSTDTRFVVPSAEDTNGIARLTVEEIVAHTERNSYRIWVGRSLTKENNPAVLINIYKQHFRFVGASQRGKSSMIAAFLEVVTRTHDINHVRLVLLDRENRTSNLFADLPHVLPMKKSDGRLVKLHARDDKTVLEYLIHCVAIMKHRYTWSVEKAASAPIILVYVEEFLALKDYFRLQIRQAKTAEAKKQAESDFATLVYCITELSREGLKVRMQLLLGAQVEYADDDFREAMASVQCGFAFCLRPKAAESAGFMQTHLVRQNAKADKVGQAVVETPDCKDLVLAPEYPLEQILLAYQKSHPDSIPVSHDIEDLSHFEREIAELITGNGNAGNAGEPLEKSFPDVGNGREFPADSGNIPDSSVHPFPIEKVMQVIQAHQELMREKQGKVTRKMLQEKLDMSNRQYSDVLKPLCDAYGILLDEKGE